MLKSQPAGPVDPVLVAPVSTLIHRPFEFTGIGRLTTRWVTAASAAGAARATAARARDTGPRAEAERILKG